MALQGEREDAEKSDLEQWKTQIEGDEEHSISKTTPEETKGNQGRKTEYAASTLSKGRGIGTAATICKERRNSRCQGRG